MASYDPQRRAALAAQLKAARKRAALSASEASRRICEQGLNCSRGTLLAWERGVGPSTREPFASDLKILAQVYGCEVEDFFRDHGVLYGHDSAAPPPAAHDSSPPLYDILAPEHAGDGASHQFDLRPQPALRSPKPPED